MNVVTLLNNAGRLSNTRKNYSSSGSERLYHIVPYYKQGAVLYQFEHRGVTVKAEHYVDIFWWGLEISRTEFPNSRPINYRGEQAFVEKAKLDSTNVRVRCSCVDFYFTFAYYNWLQDCIFGRKPREYRRKSDRGPRNPLRIPGACKHIKNSMDLLRSQGWLS